MARPFALVFATSRGTMGPMMPPDPDILTRLTGQRVQTMHRLHGGDLSDVFRLTCAGGGTMVAKYGPLVGVEGRMLDALRAAGARVPEVLATGDDILVMGDLGPDDGLGRGWASLGETLAQLHAARGTKFGWPEPYAFGTVDIPNDPCPDWPDFWAARRLRPSLPHLPAPMAHRIETLAQDLPNRIDRAQPPVLTHGDLWAGNVHVSGGRACLIDPACAYAAPEVDLAMLCLFASPPDAFWSAYGARPLPDDLRGLYQLWPALVHYRLFGAGYAPMVEQCLAACGA